jgi:hypothetical protein
MVSIGYRFRRRADLDAGRGLLHLGVAAARHGALQHLLLHGGQANAVARPAENVEVDRYLLVRAAAPPLTFWQCKAASARRPFLLAGSDECTARVA